MLADKSCLAFVLIYIWMCYVIVVVVHISKQMRCKAVCLQQLGQNQALSL